MKTSLTIIALLSTIFLASCELGTDEGDKNASISINSISPAIGSPLSDGEKIAVSCDYYIDPRSDFFTSFSLSLVIESNGLSYTLKEIDLEDLEGTKTLEYEVDNQYFTRFGNGPYSMYIELTKVSTDEIIIATTQSFTFN